MESGPYISPQDRVGLYSDKEYEAYIEEWAFHTLRNRGYEDVERVTGPGDMGIDVIAYKDKKTTLFENYQCKHYAKQLTPAVVWVEIGKMVYYSYTQQINYPEKYYFVAPKGVSAGLKLLLRDPIKLRKGLIDHWEKKCKKEISKKVTIDLTDDLKKHINALDFSIYDSIQPLEVLEDLRGTNVYIERFGGVLPERPEYEKPTSHIKSIEMVYVTQLLDAYSDHSGTRICSLEDLKKNESYLEHFARSRFAFYDAEALERFSRDTLFPNSTLFEDLKEEVYQGVVDLLNLSTEDGYSNVVKVTQEAINMPLDSSPIKMYLTNPVRKGVCHQLANNNKLKWVKVRKKEYEK